MNAPLPAGKLPPDLLAELFRTLGNDPSVIIGPGIGRDAAAVRVDQQMLVFKTDPITFATDEIGWYAAHVNANDLACLGAAPRWALATLLLPEGATTSELVMQVFGDLTEGCDIVGATIIGGHSEITSGLQRPILALTMIGITDDDRIIDPRRARPGDAVLLARGIAIEGTALIARELPDALIPHLASDVVERCQRFLHDPGISIVPAANVLREALGPRIHALHDPTEGGLATGLRELAVAAGCGMIIDRQRVTVYPETALICDVLGLDPLGLIASGALLAVVAPDAAADGLDALRRAGIPAEQIGRLVPDPGTVTMHDGDAVHPLPTFAVDEIARLFQSDDGH